MAMTPRTYGAIGPSFYGPEALDYRARAKTFGKTSSDDPDSGGYHLNLVHWNSDTGVGSFSTTDALPDGWMGLNPCDCDGGDDGCQCHS